MENHLFPAIGSKPIDTLKTRDLMPMLVEMTEKGIGATTSRVKPLWRASSVMPCNGELSITTLPTI